MAITLRPAVKKTACWVTAGAPRFSVSPAAAWESTRFNLETLPELIWEGLLPELEVSKANPPLASSRELVSSDSEQVVTRALPVVECLLHAIREIMQARAR